MASAYTSPDSLLASLAGRSLILIGAAVILGLYWEQWPRPLLLLAGLAVFALSLPVLGLAIWKGRLRLAFGLGVVGDIPFSAAIMTVLALAPGAPMYLFYVVTSAAIALACFYLGPRWGPAVAAVWIGWHLVLDTMSGANATHLIGDTAALAAATALFWTLSAVYHRALRSNQALAAGLQQRLNEIHGLNTLLNQHLGRFLTVTENLGQLADNLELEARSGTVPAAALRGELLAATKALRELAKAEPA